MYNLSFGTLVVYLVKIILFQEQSCYKYPNLSFLILEGEVIFPFLFLLCFLLFAEVEDIIRNG